MDTTNAAKIRYQNTVEDFLSFAKRTHASVRILRYLRVSVYVGMGIYFAYLYLRPPNEFEIFRSLFPPLVVFFVALPLAEGIIIYLTPLRLDPRLLQPQTVSISSDGVEIQNESQERLVPWNELAVESDDQYIFLIVPESMAQVIPRRAFQSPFASEDFGDLAEHYWHAATESE